MSENSGEIDQGNLQKKVNTYTRRAVLGVGGGGLVALGLNKLVGRGEASPTYTEMVTDKGLKIFLDSEGLPVAAVTPDKKTVKFDHDRVREVRDRAVSGNESEVLDAINLGKVYKETRPPIGSEKSYPYREGFLDSANTAVVELPPDVLSEKELKRRGVKIIQGDSTKMHIRQGAFAPGEPLAHYANSDDEITIALLDSPVVTPHATNDEKYPDKIKEIATREFPQHSADVALFRESKAESAQRFLPGLRDCRPQLKPLLGV